MSPRVFHSFFFGSIHRGDHYLDLGPDAALLAPYLIGHMARLFLFNYKSVVKNTEEKTLLENCHIDLDQTPETYVLYIYTT